MNKFYINLNIFIHFEIKIYLISILLCLKFNFIKVIDLNLLFFPIFCQMNK